MSISKMSGDLCRVPVVQKDGDLDVVVRGHISEVKREIDKSIERWEVLAKKIAHITTCPRGVCETDTPERQVKKSGWNKKKEGYHTL